MYFTNRYSVYDLRYCFCCIPIIPISEDIGEELVKIISNISNEIGIIIDKITIEEFLVYVNFSCQINAPSLLSIINTLKGVSSRKLRQKFPELQNISKNFWLKGYYIITIGENSEGRLKRALNRIRKNIRGSKEEEIK